MNPDHGSAEARRLLQALERRWRKLYSPEELEQHAITLLKTLRDALAKNREDARLVRKVYLRLAAGDTPSRREIKAANQALLTLLESLGLAALWMIPGSTIGLPTLHALAKHFDIELAPPPSTEHQSRNSSMNEQPNANPLSPDELEGIHAWWRAANYLSAGQIFLMDNPLLEEPLRAGQIKPRR